MTVRTFDAARFEAELQKIFNRKPDAVISAAARRTFRYRAHSLADRTVLRAMVTPMRFYMSLYNIRPESYCRFAAFAGEEEEGLEITVFLNEKAPA